MKGQLHLPPRHKRVSLGKGTFSGKTGQSLGRGPARTLLDLLSGHDGPMRLDFLKSDAKLTDRDFTEALILLGQRGYIRRYNATLYGRHVILVQPSGRPAPSHPYLKVSLIGEGRR